jgi:hypothetical protein
MNEGVGTNKTMRQDTESLSFWSSTSSSFSSEGNSEDKVSSPARTTATTYDSSKQKGDQIQNYKKYSSLIAARFSRLYSSLFDLIDKEGIAFRARLVPRDVQDIRLARYLFHACSIVPPLLYYFGTTPIDSPSKFPASISFTIRKGPPKHAQLLLWVAGWAMLGRVIRRAESTLLQKFTLKMILTGIWTTQLFRLGRNTFSDAMHFGGAGIYMLDHIVFLKLLKTRPKFQALFYASFLCLIASIGRLKRLEFAAKLPGESDATSNTRDRARRVARLPSKLRGQIFWCELALMLSENLLFASFVQGMPSGVEEEHVAKENKINLELQRKGDTVPLDEDETREESTLPATLD